ncbi:WG repeat-containing protein [Pseudoflavitalea sp. G-6-1-2]|uniref:WG repeat-containing protein n=1 Tax=Pseudoflavitalea sp. G-6-1-2 TaxID=2728841 RepID=UPI00146C152B|nr:WG repeat-containing protein [Pseudoflavitalea sp. G-6-1-2]NML24103.1 WG repeat-containing protein [Pseudoflavitalea sp. G-6-1-2]
MLRNLSIMISCTMLFSCNDNTANGQAAADSVSVSSAPADTAAPAQKTFVSPTKLTGHLDKKNDYWVCDDPEFEASAFDNRKSVYASLSRMDADRNTLGIGLISRKGDVIVPPIYKSIEIGFSYGVCQVGKDDKYGLVDTSGKEIVAPIYDYIGQVEDSMMLVKNSEKYGLINLKGEILIPIQYNALRSAGEGMVSFMTEPQRWGYLNLKNEVIVAPLFTFTERFSNGSVVLQKPGGEDYIIYKNGKIEKK